MRRVHESTVDRPLNPEGVRNLDRSINIRRRRGEGRAVAHRGRERCRQRRGRCELELVLRRPSALNDERMAWEGGETHRESDDGGRGIWKGSEASRRRRL